MNLKPIFESNWNRNVKGLLKSKLKGYFKIEIWRTCKIYVLQELENLDFKGTLKSEFKRNFKIEI